MMTCPYPDRCDTSICALCEYPYGSPEEPKCPNCGETTYIGYIQPDNGDLCRWVCDICDITWGEEKPEPLTPADAPAPLDSEPPLGNCPNCWMPDDVSFRGFVDGSHAQFYCDNCGYGWIEEAQL